MDNLLPSLPDPAYQLTGKELPESPKQPVALDEPVAKPPATTPSTTSPGVKYDRSLGYNWSFLVNPRGRPLFRPYPSTYLPANSEEVSYRPSPGFSINTPGRYKGRSWVTHCEVVWARDYLGIGLGGLFTSVTCSLHAGCSINHVHCAQKRANDQVFRRARCYRFGDKISPPPHLQTTIFELNPCVAKAAAFPIQFTSQPLCVHDGSIAQPEPVSLQNWHGHICQFTGCRVNLW